jgi:alkylation response protein AidB-like acyl-CoA dehydrogenase
VELEPAATTTGDQEYRLVLEGAHVDGSDALGRPGAGPAIIDWILDRTLAGLCALELGVAGRALRMTADYTGQRKQFGKAIATFQAVAQRAADAFIDVEAIRLATWQALWRLDEGLPASREVAVAKFWAAEGGHRACYAAQHLHGGIGVDTDYPLHHYYLMSRQIELTLGGAHAQLARLGDMLASAAPARG